MDCKGTVIHNIDLAWALAATLGAAYPLHQLRTYLHLDSARELALLIVTFAAYPWAMAVFHLTPFDRGLVYSICLFSVPAYARGILRFIGCADDVVKKARLIWFSLAAPLSIMALSNPWHGYFAQFQTPTVGQPNHLLKLSLIKVLQYAQVDIANDVDALGSEL